MVDANQLSTTRTEENMYSCLVANGLNGWNSVCLLSVSHSVQVCCEVPADKVYMCTSMATTQQSMMIVQNPV